MTERRLSRLRRFWHVEIRGHTMTGEYRDIWNCTQCPTAWRRR